MYSTHTINALTTAATRPARTPTRTAVAIIMTSITMPGRYCDGSAVRPRANHTAMGPAVPTARSRSHSCHRGRALLDDDGRRGGVPVGRPPARGEQRRQALGGPARPSQVEVGVGLLSLTSRHGQRRADLSAGEDRQHHDRADREPPHVLAQLRRIGLVQRHGDGIAAQPEGLATAHHPLREEGRARDRSSDHLRSFDGGRSRRLVQPDDGERSVRIAPAERDGVPTHVLTQTTQERRNEPFGLHPHR